MKSAPVFRPRLSIRYALVPVLSKPIICVVNVSSMPTLSRGLVWPVAVSIVKVSVPPAALKLLTNRTRKSSSVVTEAHFSFLNTSSFSPVRMLTL